MKTSYLLYLALCLAVFTSSVLAACDSDVADGIFQDGEQCDTNGAEGCTADCIVEDNYECDNTVGSISVCYDLFTVDKNALFIQLSNLYFSSGRFSVSPAFNLSRLDAAGISTLPTVVLSPEDAALFTIVPHVDELTGDIVWEIHQNQSAHTKKIDFVLNIPLEAPTKREIVGTTVKHSMTPFVGDFCPTEVRGTDPTLGEYTQPNKKFICVRSDFGSPIFYLKRVELRRSVEFQPGDIFETGVLDCNCNWIRLFQA